MSHLNFYGHNLSGEAEMLDLHDLDTIVAEWDISGVAACGIILDEQASVGTLFHPSDWCWVELFVNSF